MVKNEHLEGQIEDLVLRNKELSRDVSSTRALLYQAQSGNLFSFIENTSLYSKLDKTR